MHLQCLLVGALCKYSGCVYLEKQGVEGAFRADRLWLMSMISSQMGISLTNASLFGELCERTVQLGETNKRLQVFFGARYSHSYFLHFISPLSLSVSWRC